MKKLIFWMIFIYLIWQLPEVQYATRNCAQTINSFLDQFDRPTIMPTGKRSLQKKQ